jgi:DNA-binding MarR family transcriptional regulator
MAVDLEDLALYVKRLQDRHHRALDARLAELGVSLVQWNALREIERHPGTSSRGLGQLTFQTEQSFGTLATRLVRRGLIERVDAPGRAVLHQLTPRGHELLEEGRVLHREVIERSFSPLGAKDRETLAGLLVRLLDAPEWQNP